MSARPLAGAAFACLAFGCLAGDALTFFLPFAAPPPVPWPPGPRDPWSHRTAAGLLFLAAARQALHSALCPSGVVAQMQHCNMGLVRWYFVHVFGAPPPDAVHFWQPHAPSSAGAGASLAAGSGSADGATSSMRPSSSTTTLLRPSVWLHTVVLYLQLEPLLAELAKDNRAGCCSRMLSGYLLRQTVQRCGAQHGSLGAALFHAVLALPCERSHASVITASASFSEVCIRVRHGFTAGAATLLIRGWLDRRPSRSRCRSRGVCCVEPVRSDSCGLSRRHRRQNCRSCCHRCCLSMVLCLLLLLFLCRLVPRRRARFQATRALRWRRLGGLLRRVFITP